MTPFSVWTEILLLLILATLANVNAFTTSFGPILSKSGGSLSRAPDLRLGTLLHVRGRVYGQVVSGALQAQSKMGGGQDKTRMAPSDKKRVKLPYGMNQLQSMQELVDILDKLAGDVSGADAAMAMNILAKLSKRKIGGWWKDSGAAKVMRELAETVLKDEGGLKGKHVALAADAASGSRELAPFLSALSARVSSLLVLQSQQKLLAKPASARGLTSTSSGSSEFTGQGLAMVLSAYAALVPGDDRGGIRERVFQSAGKALSSSLATELDSHSWSRIVNAFSRAGLLNLLPMETVVTHITRLPPTEASPIDISLVANACVRARVVSKSLMQWLRQAIDAVPRGAWGQEEVVSVWGALSVIVTLSGSSSSIKRGDEYEDGDDTWLGEMSEDIRDWEGEWKWDEEDGGGGVVWDLCRRMAEEALSLDDRVWGTRGLSLVINAASHCKTRAKANTEGIGALYEEAYHHMVQILTAQLDREETSCGPADLTVVLSGLARGGLQSEETRRLALQVIKRSSSSIAEGSSWEYGNLASLADSLLKIVRAGGVEIEYGRVLFQNIVEQVVKLGENGPVPSLAAPLLLHALSSLNQPSLTSSGQSGSVYADGKVEGFEDAVAILIRKIVATPSSKMTTQMIGLLASSSQALYGPIKLNDSVDTSSSSALSLSHLLATYISTTALMYSPNDLNIHTITSLLSALPPPAPTTLSSLPPSIPPLITHLSLALASASSSARNPPRARTVARAAIACSLAGMEHGVVARLKRDLQVMPLGTWDVMTIVRVSELLANANDETRDLAMLRRVSWEARHVGNADDWENWHLISLLENLTLIRGDRDHMLWRHCSRLVRARIEIMSTTDVSRALQSFSKKRLRDGSLFRMASVKLLNTPRSSFSIRDIEVIVFAYARAGVWDEPLFRRMGKISRQLIDDCPDGRLLEQVALLCNVFSYAESREGSMIRAGSMFRFLSQKIMSSGTEVAGTATTRHIANILNAFARSRVWDEALFRRLSMIVRTMQPVATPAKDIAFIVNAYSQATTRVGSTLRDTSLFLHMARLALLKSDSELTARNVASIVNAFARAGVWDERIFKKMSASLRRMPKESVEMRDIARIVHAFSLAQTRAGSTIRDGSLFRHMSARLIRILLKRKTKPKSKDTESVVSARIRASISDIAATAKAYTRAGIWDERLFRLLSGSVKDEISSNVATANINARDVAEIVSAFSKMETRSGSTLRDGALFMLLSSHTRSMTCKQLSEDPRALANIVNAFARAGVWDEALFRHMSRAARMTDPRAISINDCAALVGSFAKAQTRAGARLRDGALFRRMSLTVQAKKPSAFTPRAVSNILSSFARAGVWDRLLFRRITRIALSLEGSDKAMPLQSFKSQELAQLAWAMAKVYGTDKEDVGLTIQVQQIVGPSGKSIFIELSDEIKRRGLGEFKNQEAATILWALGTSGEECSATFEAASRDLQERDTSRFNPVDISNIVWAYSMARHKAPDLFRKLSQEVLRKGGLETFPSLTMSNMAVSFARAGYLDHELFLKIKEQILSRSISLQPLQLVTSLQSAEFVEMQEEEETKLVGRKEFEVGEKTDVGEVIRARMTVTCQDLVGVAWAGCLHDEEVDNELFQRLLKSAESNLHYISYPSLIQLAQVIIHMMPLTSPDKRPASPMGSNMTNRTLGNYSGWEAHVAMQESTGGRKGRSGSMGVEGRGRSSTRIGSFGAGRQSSSRGRSQSFSGRVLDDDEYGVFPRETQLEDTETIARDLQRRSNVLSEAFALNLVHALRVRQPMAERRGQAKKPQSSRLHVKVSHALGMLGVRHKNEQEVMGGVCYIDIAVEGGVAIEVDGPSHFAEGSVQRNPETLFRARVLEKLGWRVISISFFEWEELRGRQDLQAAYLSRRMKEVSLDM